MPQIVHYQDLGLVDYASTWDHQTACHQLLISRKKKIHQGEDLKGTVPHTFIICEHPHVYTLGKSGHASHLLLDEQQLAEVGATYYKINRGGDITYHGPGQIVGYPILDLEDFFRDVHRYVRNLEELIIRVIGQYGLTGIRLDGYTGVWLAPNVNQPVYRKICAIGVHLSRWVTLHGFAFNINTDLDYFDHIVPCGIDDRNKSVTSMAAELGHQVDIVMVKQHLKREFEIIFGCSLSNQEPSSHVKGY